MYKNETKCKEIIEEITGYEFITTRSLKCLQGLELDGYCKELNLAFEYNGQQHYNFYPGFFHKKEGIHQFIRQICRDKIKIRLCKENNIKLIIIPYRIKDKRKFIEDKLKLQDIVPLVVGSVGNIKIS